MHLSSPSPKLFAKLTCFMVTALSVGVGANIASAQDSIVPTSNSPMSTDTTVNYGGTQYEITGGAFSGNGLNQFHHFSQFGLETNETVNFITPSQVQNLINLIEGGQSTIDGLIQITGSQANLYLINPAGVIFGPNARLNIPASLSVSTADGLMFGNALLTVDGLPLSGTTLENIAVSGYDSFDGAPTGYVFATLQPEAIVNQGDLAVNSGADIMLLGGTVRHDGSLTAPGGSVTLAAVSGGHLLRVSRPGDVLSLEIDPIVDPAHSSVPTPFDARGAITLPQRLTGTGVDEATQMTVTPQGAVVLSSSTSAAGGAGLNPEETGTVLVRGDIDVSSPSGPAGEINILGLRVASLGSDLSADGQVGGKINLGRVLNPQVADIEAVYILIDRGTQLSATALAGTGGNIYVWADNQVQFFGQTDVSGLTAPGTVLIDSDGTVERLSPKTSRSAR